MTLVMSNSLEKQMDKWIRNIIFALVLILGIVMRFILPEMAWQFGFISGLGIGELMAFN